MTKKADFKQLVRARMAKTGESYTAARAQLLSEPRDPTPEEFADIAGYAEATVVDKTGKGWSFWVDALDGLGGSEMSHKDIAAAVREHWPEVGAWWAQSLTVGYERIRGLRVKGQKCTGDFSASKSKTFAVPVARLFAEFADGPREAWMQCPSEVRTTQKNRSVRLTWPDGTIVAAWFTDKGEKSSVSIEHSKLESLAQRDAVKKGWAERFARLAERLADAR